MAITKTEFINKIAHKGKLKKSEASKQVDLFLDTIMDCLTDNGEVKLHGFGKFELKEVKGHIGRNPKTKEQYIIPKHKKVKFYASETLTERIKRQ